MKEPKKNRKPEELLVFEIDRALTLLVDTCDITSKKMGGVLPIDMIKGFKKTLIDGYKEGIKDNPNFK